ncbi:LOW QUALITY PROTEIN: retinitis pigmentosa 9 protein homolog [Marmota marmota marmota]|uniref:LOW QUALITY PROTEIN: retinitis pigmentosa 9 protein homolog n=1 Tax=Marmota marmota marmota TaxID=9994 RepID=UPI00209318E2|nr:LOW QUALITY PROTEIN: retinitis pigmentosa 9 protein homolog [Marmota marmota marmota]
MGPRLDLRPCRAARWDRAVSCLGWTTRRLGACVQCPQEQKRRRLDAQQPQQLKHLESFYEKPPPGLMGRMRLGQKMIPDIPGNEHAREFLAHAPTKGLWMPLGKEVKVMQCWCCRRYGHREGDKECPLFIKGNQKLEVQSTTEDPMYDIIQENKRKQQLKQLLEDSTSDEDGSSSSSSECKEKHKKKERETHLKKETLRVAERSPPSPSVRSALRDTEHPAPAHLFPAALQVAEHRPPSVSVPAALQPFGSQRTRPPVLLSWQPSRMESTRTPTPSASVLAALRSQSTRP